MNYIDIIKELLVKNELIEIIISGKEEKTTEYNKISIKPFLKDEIIYFQFAYIYDIGVETPDNNTCGLFRALHFCNYWYHFIILS